MLQKLFIRNYALIDELVFEPSGNLNVITGETGAGKSMLIGALSLILGERADTNFILTDDTKCIIEGTFLVNSLQKQLQQVFEDQDLDWEDVLTIRRELNAKGKSRAFINDTPVALGVLQKVTSQLVALHHQFDNQQIADAIFQIEALDAVAQATPLRAEYQLLYKQWECLSAQIKKLQQQIAQEQKEQDYLKYLLQELDDFQPKKQEIEDLEEQLKQVQHKEKIQLNLSAAVDSLMEADSNVLSQLKKTIQNLTTIAPVWADALAIVHRMETCYEELKDVNALLEERLSHSLHDATNADALIGRYDLGQKLFKKHAVAHTDELIETWQTIKDKLNSNEHNETQLLTWQKEQATLYKTLTEHAAKLSQLRKKAIPSFAKTTTEYLQLMGMKNAVFHIDLTPTEQPNFYGQDQIVFAMDANKSGKFLPINKTASGGERSRIMLAIKAQIAGSIYMPTLIFDEVDTGISGEAARQVALLLQQLGLQHQVICITHQPQIAAAAQEHFYLYKAEDKSGKIKTGIAQLTGDTRIAHIAEMITGKEQTEAALQHAQELLRR